MDPRKRYAMRANAELQMLGENNKDRELTIAFMKDALGLGNKKVIRESVWDRAKAAGRRAPGAADLNHTLALPFWVEIYPLTNLRDKLNLASFLDMKKVAKNPLIKGFKETEDSTVYDRKGKPLVLMVRVPYSGDHVIHGLRVEDPKLPGVRVCFSDYYKDDKEMQVIRHFYLESMEQFGNTLRDLGFELTLDCE